MDMFKSFTRRSLALVCLIGGFAVGTVQAATVNPDEPTASSSTGKVDVTVTVPELFWIRNLDEISLTYVPGTPTTANESFCIFSTNAAYDLTISGTNATGSTDFQADGAAVPANNVIFNVLFDDDDDASTGGGSVTEGALIDGVVSSNSGLPPDCTVDNVAIFVEFPEVGNLDSAPADTYSEELTLLVEPD